VWLSGLADSTVATASWCACVDGSAREGRPGDAAAAAKGGPSGLAPARAAGLGGPAMLRPRAAAAS
jgi:hypothetical protein